MIEFEQAFIGNDKPMMQFTVYGSGVTIFSNPKRIVFTIACPFARPVNRQPTEEECKFVTANVESLTRYMFAEAIIETPTEKQIPVMIRTIHPS